MPTAPVRAQRRDWLAAAAVLAFLLIIAFAPVVFGQRHLMLAAWDAPSITNSGAYDPVPRPPGIRVARTTDPGAPAWTIEPWFKLISEQYWGEFSLPLWNPYNAFGMPLAAAAQPQPFFPLTALLSLHVTTWTYSLFILARLLLGGLLAYFFARQFLASLPVAVRSDHLHAVRILHSLSQHAASERRGAHPRPAAGIRDPGETKLLGGDRGRCRDDLSHQHRRHAGVDVPDRFVRLSLFRLPGLV